jgi:hypothetical protein
MSLNYSPAFAVSGLSLSPNRARSKGHTDFITHEAAVRLLWAKNYPLSCESLISAGLGPRGLLATERVKLESILVQFIQKLAVS